MKRVQFAATYPERLVHPLHRQVIESGPVTRAELLTWSPTADATTLFWCDADADATAPVVRATDSLVDSELVEDGGGTYAFLRQDDYEFAPAVLDAIAAARVVFLPPVVFLETGEVRFEAVGEAGALGAFHEALTDLGDVTIERVHEFERTASPSRLTDRQRAALEAAVAAGYYEVPRDGTIADVAAALDCSTSTAGELVRKAETAVIREFVAAGEED
ncbi:helix-turn-helix domain-containing protein [Halorubrum lipolyticum]|uniref:Bacterio-opsin activator HTH domain protein n=1 Tax=Halorubrum lipolyticum DSM 21995 TaxID=1227482 RepID=M0NPI9_9EURY|nr:helix-turn-helix domain-containing protein [Halorubrum lipolyticum]EMA59089.1 Bacterio-opsin activator HTH domain protein [Halorubrum lipolyticum DSM 21995]